MKKIFFIFGLMFLCACREEIEVNVYTNYEMVLSDALPVQFWVNGVETYNQKEPFGIYRSCYCQKWNCDDEIKLQFVDGNDTTYYLRAYDEDGAELVAIEFTKQAGSGQFIYSVTFVPSDEDICSEKIQLRITGGYSEVYEIDFDPVSLLVNSEFDSGSSGWSSTTESGGVWSFSNNGSENIAGTTLAPTTNSKKLHQLISGDAGNYRVMFRARSDASSTNTSVRVAFALGSIEGTVANDIHVVTQTIPVGSDVTFDNIEAVPSSFDRIYIRMQSASVGIRVFELDYFDVIQQTVSMGDFSNVGSGASWSVVGSTITSNPNPTAKTLRFTRLFTADTTYLITFDGTAANSESMIAKDDQGVTLATLTLAAPYTHAFYYTPLVNSAYMDFFVSGGDGDAVEINNFLVEATGVFAQSDCLDIQPDHEGTMLITYSNHRDFADINSANVSPDTEFYLRIPAVFYHEDFPQEQEAMDLTSSQIVLNSHLKAQRLLQTDYLPYYMHRKIILVLMHNVVYADGEYWEKIEPYEIIKGRKTHPLKMANVLLNESEFVKRNVL